MNLIRHLFHSCSISPDPTIYIYNVSYLKLYKIWLPLHFGTFQLPVNNNTNMVVKQPGVREKFAPKLLVFNV
jgi:hypothetical protein